MDVSGLLLDHPTGRGVNAVKFLSLAGRLHLESLPLLLPHP